MKEKRNETSNYTVTHKFLLLHFAIFIILFLFLTPKVSARIFPFIPEFRYQSFIQQIQSSQKVDARRYWEFREFYSPGSFHFNKTGLSDAAVNPVEVKSNVKLSDNIELIPFLVFSSPMLESADYLTNTSVLDNIFREITLNDYSVILKTDTELVYRIDTSTLVLIFVKNLEEMKQANGFYDYRIADKEFTVGKNWLNITIITH